VYDPHARIFYVGNGGRAAHESFSYVSKIAIDTHQVVGRIRVDAATLKTLVLDTDAQTLYVSMRDKSEVGAIDLRKNVVSATWSSPQLHIDSAMAYDQPEHLLFVGDRNPGRLIVLNTNDGSVMATIPIGDTSDDITYDKEHRRVFISSADGVDVLSQDSPNRYHILQHVDTLGGKTSVYVPSLQRFFVVHTKGDKASEAGLQIFKVQ
jgi:DNA-binding beta-propeller fold protein YncE